MNVLFIIADALRADHLHCYGYPEETSPFMDKLAAEGVLFENAVANCNHTLPGVVSLLTGLYQTTHKMDGPANFKQWGSLWKNRPAPLGVFGKNGYVVAGCDPQIYFHLGFRAGVVDVSAAVEDNRDHDFFIWYRSETTHLPYNPPPPYDRMFLPDNYAIPETAGEKLELVKTKLIIHRPGFLSRLENGKPDPIEKPGYERTFGETAFSEAERPAAIALYDGKVRVFDAELEGYVKKLEELNILDKTMIVLTADHGEQLFERGALGHSSCSLEGNLYDENIRIPLIIRCPSRLPKGRVVSKQVSQVDVLPTILDVLGLQMPDQADGKSLQPLIRDEDADFREEAYAMTQPCGWQMLEGDNRMIYCIRTPRWKLISYENPDNRASDYCELFDLQNDPAERNNLFSRFPEIAGELKIKLSQWSKSGNEGKE